MAGTAVAWMTNVGRCTRIEPREKTYILIGRDSQPYESPAPGTLGGHRAGRIYGRLDCPNARRWIARGHYIKQRVFFADEETARAAGYRPCAVCLPEAYAAWKSAQAARNRAPEE